LNWPAPRHIPPPNAYNFRRDELRVLECLVRTLQITKVEALSNGVCLSMDLAREINLKERLDLFGENIHPFLKDRLYLSEKQIESLTPEVKTRVLSTINLHTQIAQHTRFLTDEEAGRVGLKLALQFHGLFPVDNIIDYIDPGDLVEIYDHNIVQLYGNIHFLRKCSYDIATLHSSDIRSLYTRRPSKITDEVFKWCAECFTKGDRTVAYRIEEHLLKETKLENPKFFLIQFKYLSPLKNKNGETVAIVTTNKCRRATEKDLQKYLSLPSDSSYSNC
jgi:hypothetical protein